MAARVFETLGELGGYVGETGFEIVDPGMPLTEWNADATFGPAWKNQPSVRKVVGFAARNLASTRLHTYERLDDDSRERVRDGALAQLIRRPSRAPGVTAYRLWESLLIDGLLYDKYIAQIVEHVDGFELVRIPARMVSLKSDGLGRISKLAITNAKGHQIEADPSDYLIDVGYSERGANGTSPLRTLRALLDEYSEAVRYRQQIWKNSARAPYAIVRKEPFPPDGIARERFTRSWASFTKGGGNEGGTPILEDDERFEKLDAFRPKDTLDLEGRKLTDIEVCGAYHIPPELVGSREGTFANVKAYREMLFGPVLGPYIEAWEQALNLTLTPRLEPDRDIYIEANIDGKLRGSFSEEADVLSTAAGAPWMTRNEVRARKNLPALERGDELVTPLNVLIGGQASPQDGETAGGGGSLASLTSVTQSADDLAKLVSSAGALIRAGFDPQASLAAVGLDPIEHLGLLPVTVREDEKSASDVGGVLEKFRERQLDVARRQKTAGVLDWWDRERWDRELTADLVKAGFAPAQAAGIARLANNESEQLLLAEGSNS